MELTAICERDDGWWIVTVPTVRGLYTQVRRLDQVEAMVKDAASLYFEQPEEDFTVTVVPQLDAATMNAVSQAATAKDHLRASEDVVAATNRAAASLLANAGLTLRDIGSILGVSHQRAHQLISV